MFIVEDHTGTVKCQSATKMLYLYLNLCLSVMLKILICRRDRDVMVIGFATPYAISP